MRFERSWPRRAHAGSAPVVERPKDSEGELSNDSDGRLSASLRVVEPHAGDAAQLLETRTLPVVPWAASERVERLRAIWNAIPFVAGGLYARVLGATARYIGAPNTFEAFAAADVHMDVIAEALVADGLVDEAEWQVERKREALRTIAERLELDPDHVADLLDELEAVDPALEDRLACALDNEHRDTFPTDEDIAAVAAALPFCAGSKLPIQAH